MREPPSGGGAEAMESNSTSAAPEGASTGGTIAGVFVSRTGADVRVAVTGAAACVFRAAEMEQALAGNFNLDALEGIGVDGTDFNNDLHASAEYRTHLVSVMAKRAVAKALG